MEGIGSWSPPRDKLHINISLLTGRTGARLRRSQTYC
jgi:hypothetical protein